MSTQHKSKRQRVASPNLSMAKAAEKECSASCDPVLAAAPAFPSAARAACQRVLRMVSDLSEMAHVAVTEGPDASVTWRCARLRKLRNEIVGNAHKKKLYIENGVVSALAGVLGVGIQAKEAEALIPQLSLGLSCFKLLAREDSLVPHIFRGPCELLRALKNVIMNHPFASVVHLAAECLTETSNLLQALPESASKTSALEAWEHIFMTENFIRHVSAMVRRDMDRAVQFSDQTFHACTISLDLLCSFGKLLTARAGCRKSHAVLDSFFPNDIGGVPVLLTYLEATKGQPNTIHKLLFIVSTWMKRNISECKGASTEENLKRACRKLEVYLGDIHFGNRMAAASCLLYCCKHTPHLLDFQTRQRLEASLISTVCNLQLSVDRDRLIRPLQLLRQWLDIGAQTFTTDYGLQIVAKKIIDLIDSMVPFPSSRELLRESLVLLFLRLCDGNYRVTQLALSSPKVLTCLKALVSIQVKNVSAVAAAEIVWILSCAQTSAISLLCDRGFAKSLLMGIDNADSNFQRVATRALCNLLRYTSSKKVRARHSVGVRLERISNRMIHVSSLEILNSGLQNLASLAVSSSCSVIQRQSIRALANFVSADPVVASSVVAAMGGWPSILDLVIVKDIARNTCSPSHAKETTKQKRVAVVSEAFALMCNIFSAASGRLGDTTQGQISVRDLVDQSIQRISCVLRAAHAFEEATLYSSIMALVNISVCQPRYCYTALIRALNDVKLIFTLQSERVVGAGLELLINLLLNSRIAREKILAEEDILNSTRIEGLGRLLGENPSDRHENETSSNFRLRAYVRNYFAAQQFRGMSAVSASGAASVGDSSASERKSESPAPSQLHPSTENGDTEDEIFVCIRELHGTIASIISRSTDVGLTMRCQQVMFLERWLLPSRN